METYSRIHDVISDDHPVRRCRSGKGVEPISERWVVEIKVLRNRLHRFSDISVVEIPLSIADDMAFVGMLVDRMRGL